MKSFDRDDKVVITAILITAITGILFAMLLINWINTGINTFVKQDDMARQMLTLVQAGGHYIRANHDALLAQEKDGRPVTISDQTLQDKGYLPPGFSLENTRHQHYRLNITGDPKKPSGLIAFVFTTDGTPIDDSAIASIASQIPHGGYIGFPGDMAVAADDSWHIFLSNYGVTGQPGHLLAWIPDDMLPGGEVRPDTLPHKDIFTVH